MSSEREHDITRRDVLSVLASEALPQLRAVPGLRRLPQPQLQPQPCQLLPPPQLQDEYLWSVPPHSRPTTQL